MAFFPELKLKNAWLPPPPPPLFFFSHPTNPYQDLHLIFPRTYKPFKNIFVLAGTAIKKPDFLGPSQGAQNVCAVAKGGTVLKQVHCAYGPYHAVLRPGFHSFHQDFMVSWPSLIFPTCENPKSKTSPFISDGCLGLTPINKSQALETC